MKITLTLEATEPRHLTLVAHALAVLGEHGVSPVGLEAGLRASAVTDTGPDTAPSASPTVATRDELLAAERRFLDAVTPAKATARHAAPAAPEPCTAPPDSDEHHYPVRAESADEAHDEEPVPRTTTPSPERRGSKVCRHCGTANGNRASQCFNCFMGFPRKKRDAA